MRYTRGAFNTALDHLTRYSPMRTRVLSSCPSVVASSRPSAPVGSRPGWMPLTRSPRISNANLDEYLDGNMSFSLLLIVVAAAEARLRQSQFFFLYIVRPIGIRRTAKIVVFGTVCGPTAYFRSRAHQCVVKYDAVFHTLSTRC
jgi:hypothetical protein